jgi:thymidylate synthase (FAD)
MKVKLLNHTKNPEAVIGEMAGICYGKENSDVQTCVKRAAHCVEKGHLSTLRFAHATFHVSGISRVCSHQFVRSKHLDFLQRSQRYCNESESDIVIPGDISKNESLNHWFNSSISSAFMTYEKLISEGVKKEDARMILPQCTTTELIVVGNFQAYKDLIKLRCNKESQWEIRAVVEEIREQLATIAPNIFGSNK